MSFNYNQFHNILRLFDDLSFLPFTTRFIQRRLDYFFVSNSLQKSIKSAVSTDHSPITLSLCHLKGFSQGRGLWKFNKFLIKNENYREQKKMPIKNLLNNLEQVSIVDPQFR